MSSFRNKNKQVSISRKLFLVCPFSSMEHFIRHNFGDEIIFMTAMATESQFHEIEYSEAIREIIVCENIEEMFVVNDTSCRFINGVLRGDKFCGTAAEKSIQNILIDNYSFVMQHQTLSDKVKALAALNIKQQAFEICANELFKPLIIQRGIEIKGLITTKSENKILAISLHSHEL